MIYIFTLNWNGEDKLKELYNSFNSLNKEFDYTWYIKDNNSTDGSVKYLESLNDDKLKIIKHPHNNDSFAYGMNYLFKLSNPKDNDLVLLLNNDIVFSGKNDLNHMISYFNDKSVGIVGCKLLFKNTDLIQHAGVVFHDRLRTPMHFGLKQKDSEFFSLDREFQAVTGAVMLIKAETYKNIRNNLSGQHGMDEDFVWAFDDVSACLNVKYKQNKKIICVGNTKIFHEESATLKKNPVNKLFLNQNLAHLFSKWSKIYHTDMSKYINPKYNLYKK